MKVIQRTIGVAVVSVGLLLVTGCDTPTGALFGAALGGVTGAVIGHATGNERLGAVIGVTAGAIAGGIIVHINAEQKAKLQQTSPQTLITIQHNDEVAKQQANQSQSTAGQSPPPATEAPIPLSVEDIKALDSSGVKKDVIIASIKESKSVYSSQDIATVLQANPNIDPAIIECMKNPNRS